MSLALKDIPLDQRPTWRGLIPMPTPQEANEALARLTDRVQGILECRNVEDVDISFPMPESLFALAEEIAQVLVWEEKLRDFLCRHHPPESENGLSEA